MYTVYKITTHLDERYYVGVHKTSNSDDHYMGSGVRLRAAMKKYGRVNFKKEILYIFTDRDEAYAKEAELITSQLVASGKVFNLIAGGSVSPEWIESRRLSRRGKSQPKISAARRKTSPYVGNFLVSFPAGTLLDSPETIIYEEINDLLAWADKNNFSRSTARHLLKTGKIACQGPLRGVFIREI